MFLLSDELILRYMERGSIRIEPFSRDELYSTCYYFRLGQHIRIRRPDGIAQIDLAADGAARLEPSELALVKSYEHFSLAENVMVLLGNQTRNPVERGLQLLHGPSIDPSYKGHLDMALMNVSSETVLVSFRDGIGKAHFFDIADTALPSDHRIITLEERLNRLIRLESTTEG
jgi:deoxycytidine triphosphate deaminase